MRQNKKKAFTLVEIMIVVVIIGLLAVLAIPAFKKARSMAQEKIIYNNLRELGSAAQQYFLEEGVTTVSIGNLKGHGNYVINLETVAQEVYPTVLNANETTISTTGEPAVTYKY